MDLQIIQNKIFEVRSCRVMLDYHLAELYQVETRALKRSSAISSVFRVILCLYSPKRKLTCCYP